MLTYYARFALYYLIGRFIFIYFKSYTFLSLYLELILIFILSSELSYNIFYEEFFADYSVYCFYLFFSRKQRYVYKLLISRRLLVNTFKHGWINNYETVIDIPKACLLLTKYRLQEVSK